MRPVRRLLDVILFSAAAALSAGAWDGQPPAAEAIISVDASKPGGRVSKFLTGACIEDVNHEIYGGLYSQMIYGESFQEPSAGSPVRGFGAYGGKWKIENGMVSVEGGDGPRLVGEQPPFADGAAGVEMFLSDRRPGNAGLIVRVARPGLGPDNFDGYEISLDAGANVVRLGRHRHDWHLIKDTPYQVPVGRWVPVSVKMSGPVLEVFVDGKSVVKHDDGGRALGAGTVGLRPWQREARFRNLWVNTSGQKKDVPFVPSAEAGSEVSGMWRAVRGGTAAGRWSLDSTKPFLGTQSQRLAFAAGRGEIGIENRGLNRWGLSFVSGKPYEGYVWLRAENPTEIFVALESGNGARVYAESKLSAASGDWRKLSFTLTPTASDPYGRLALKLKRPGSVTVGHAFLQPGEWGRFKGLPVRRDVAEGMLDLGLTALRYGGSMVNCDGYRWKNMIGPRDRRPPYRGTWYPYSSNGWGIIDFLNFCDAAGVLAVPAFYAGETPQDMADFIAYVNGPPDSPWGKKRAADGHPAPYRLKHLEFGNEEKVDEEYWKKFRAVAEAVWKADPEMILVVGDFVYGRPITDPDRIQGAASGITNLSAHRKILNLARKHGREVWFDIHIGTEHPGALGELAVVPTYVDALAKLAGGAKHKVVIFELNAGNHAQRRALANAIAIGDLQRFGDRLPVVCSANGLQPDGQNDNGWDQGLLFLNPSRVWAQPPGYVHRMIARSYRPLNLTAAVKGEGGTLKVAAARDEVGKSVVLRVVNPGAKPVTARLDLSGFKAARPVATVEELTGPVGGVNTAAEPRRLAPRTRTWEHDLPGGLPSFTFAPHSFTVLTFD